MPEISRFFGIVIRMYWGEHNPPHFHACFNGKEAVICIKTAKLISGNLPLKKLTLVQAWAIIHREELLENWKLLDRGLPSFKIEELK